MADVSCVCKAKREAEAHYPPTHLPSFMEAGALMPLMIFSPAVSRPASILGLNHCQIQATSSEIQSTRVGSHLLCVTVLSYPHWLPRQLLPPFGVPLDILLCCASLSIVAFL